MEIVVLGDVKEPIKYRTDDASGILISVKGSPAVIYHKLKNNSGFVRYTRGEDKNFDEIARQLGLI